MKDRPILLGALAASFTASFCCIVPIAVAVLGVGSMSAAAAFERFRLPLSVVTFAFLGAAFYFNYHREKERCKPETACAIPANRKRTRMVLWVITVVALVFLAFPYYSRFFV